MTASVVPSWIRETHQAECAARGPSCPRATVLRLQPKRQRQKSPPQPAQTRACGNRVMRLLVIRRVVPVVLDRFGATAPRSGCRLLPFVLQKGANPSRNSRSHVLCLLSRAAVFANERGIGT